MDSWFEESGLLALDDDVAASPSFQRVMADGVVAVDELTEHAQRVLEVLRRLDAELTAEHKQLVRQALVDLAVLYALERAHDTQRLFGREATR